MLDIVPALLLVTGVIFLVLLILLNKTLYKPLLAFMDNRKKSIRRDLDSAGKNSDEVVSFKKEAEKIILEAKTEANRIKDSALMMAKDEALKKLEVKKSELESKYSQFLRELEAQKVEFKSALQEQLPQFRYSVKAKLDKI
ncbi:MAG: F0F1 ATP synthase subunit B' [Sulfurospirillum sp.]